MNRVIELKKRLPILGTNKSITAASLGASDVSRTPPRDDASHEDHNSSRNHTREKKHTLPKDQIQDKDHASEKAHPTHNNRPRDGEGQAAINHALNSFSNCRPDESQPIDIRWFCDGGFLLG